MKTQRKYERIFKALGISSTLKVNRVQQGVGHQVTKMMLGRVDRFIDGDDTDREGRRGGMMLLVIIGVVAFVVIVGVLVYCKFIKKSQISKEGGMKVLQTDVSGTELEQSTQKAKQ